MIAPSVPGASDSRCATASPTATSSPAAWACAAIPASTSTPLASIPRGRAPRAARRARSRCRAPARGPRAARRRARPAPPRARAGRGRRPRSGGRRRRRSAVARLAAEAEHAPGARVVVEVEAVARHVRHRARAGHQLLELPLGLVDARHEPARRAPGPRGGRELLLVAGQRGDVRARARRAGARAAPARARARPGRVCSSSPSRRIAAASARSSARSDAVYGCSARNSAAARDALGPPAVRRRRGRTEPVLEVAAGQRGAGRRRRGAARRRRPIRTSRSRAIAPTAAGRQLGGDVGGGARAARAAASWSP